MNLSAFLAALSTKDILNWGLNGLIIGLSSVFIILILLIFVIFIMKIATAEKEKTPVRKVKNITYTNDSIIDNDDEITAVITAAINCMAHREGKRFAIKSYKRISSKKRISYLIRRI